MIKLLQQKSLSKYLFSILYDVIVIGGGHAGC